MADGLGDKARKLFGKVGEASRKLTDLGRLKLDLMEARSQLEGRYEALGRAVADRLLDRGEEQVAAADEAVASLIEEISAARRKVAEIEAEYEERKES